jgi:hypothetical protein
MSMREREGLITRIRHIRRVTAGTGTSPTATTTTPDPASVNSLEARLAHLEQLVEGLQDSVHRESERQTKRIADLEAQIQPSVLGAALSQDARERGL